MVISQFKAKAKKLYTPVLAKHESTQKNPQDSDSPEHAVTADSKMPGIDTARIYDRDGGDFYISY